MRHVYSVLGFWASLALLASGAIHAAAPKGAGASIEAAVIDIGGQGGPVWAATGGGSVLQVADAEAGAARARAEPVTYEDIVVTVPVTAFTDIVRNALAGGNKVARYDGAINFASRDGAAVLKRSFTQAVISGVTIPTLDARSKEPASIQLTLSPQQVQDELDKGGLPSKAGEKSSGLMSSNFAVSLDGNRLNVISIGPIQVSQLAPGRIIGSERATAKAMGLTEISRIRVVVPMSESAQLQQWFNDSAAKGNDVKKALRIDLLGRDATVAMSVEASGARIAALRHQTDLRNEGPDHTEVELFVEQLNLISAGAGTKAPAAPVRKR